MLADNRNRKSLIFTGSQRIRISILALQFLGIGKTGIQHHGNVFGDVFPAFLIHRSELELTVMNHCCRALTATHINQDGAKVLLAIR